MNPPHPTIHRDGPSPEDDGGGPGLGAAAEEVESLVAQAALLEYVAAAQHGATQTLHRGLHEGPGGLGHSVQVVRGHSDGDGDSE